MNTTSAQMEILALLISLISIKDKSKTIKIYCDNQYVVYSLMKGWVYNWENDNWVGRKNSFLWKKVLYEFRKFKKGLVTLHWVKGHNGCEYNEIVDKSTSKGSRYKVIDNTLESYILQPTDNE